MKNIQGLAALLVLITSQSILAQSDLSGTWEGTLAVDAATEIDVQFIISREGNDYTAMLNAPDQPNLRNIPANVVSFDGNSLSISVDSISGTYQGTVQDGSINGTWSQQGSTFPLDLAPYAEPVLTAADQERLMGSWIGELRPVPGGEMVINIVFKFRRDEQGQFIAEFDSPDEGAFGIPLDSVELDGDDLIIELNRARMEFTGTLAADAIDGEWAQAGRTFPLSMERGEIELTGLGLPDSDFERLQGPWHGSIGNLTVVVRFEQSQEGLQRAFLDSPDQGASGIPVGTVSVEGDQLDLSVTAAQASFTGAIAADVINGQWTQGGQTRDLALERGPYVPVVNVSAQAQQQLQGEWRGTVNDTELVFRFEGESDDFTSLLDIPSLGANGLPVNNMSVEGENISFQVNAISAQFAGTLSNGAISGQWTRAGATNPLDLNRQ